MPLRCIVASGDAQGCWLRTFGAGFCYGESTKGAVFNGMARRAMRSDQWYGLKGYEKLIIRTVSWAVWVIVMGEKHRRCEI